MSDDARALRHRSPELVVAILGYIYDHDDPVPWLDTVDTFTAPGREWKTVENVLYELTAFGALHRIGKPAARGKPDTRALRPTPLGRAWLEQTLLPLPRNEQDP